MEYVYLVFMEGVMLRVFDNPESAVDYCNDLRSEFTKLDIRVDKERLWK